MMVSVEFFGPLRYYTNTRRAEVTVNRDATIKNLNASLSKQFPELIHKVIDPKNFEFIVPLRVQCECETRFGCECQNFSG